MTKTEKLDTSKLLGFDNSGKAIWSVADGDVAGQDVLKPSGATKPDGAVKPAGTVIK